MCYDHTTRQHTFDRCDLIDESKLPETAKAKFSTIVKKVIEHILEMTEKYVKMRLDDEVEKVFTKLLKRMKMTPTEFRERSANKYMVVHQHLVEMFTKDYHVNLDSEDKEWLSAYLNDASGAEWSRADYRDKCESFSRDYINGINGVDQYMRDTFISRMGFLLNGIFEQYPDFEGEDLQDALGKIILQTLEEIKIPRSSAGLGVNPLQAIVDRLKTIKESAPTTPHTGCKRFSRLLNEIADILGHGFKTKLARTLEIAPSTISEWQKDRCPELDAGLITAALIKLCEQMKTTAPVNLDRQVMDTIACTCHQRNTARHGI